MVNNSNAETHKQEDIYETNGWIYRLGFFAAHGRLQLQTIESWQSNVEHHAARRRRVVLIQKRLGRGKNL